MPSIDKGVLCGEPAEVRGDRGCGFGRHPTFESLHAAPILGNGMQEDGRDGRVSGSSGKLFVPVA